MDVKRAVLDAAVNICATEGPDAVSMREVARRSGVSHQAPYHHFGDRAGIFAAIAEEGFDKLAEAMGHAFVQGQSPSGACLDAYVGLALSNPGHFRVMFSNDICGVTTHEATGAAADRAYAALEQMVDQILERPLDANERALWASLLWSIAHGFATLLIEGPLAAKLPPGTDIRTHTAQFKQLASSMVERFARDTSAAGN